MSIPTKRVLDEKRMSLFPRQGTRRQLYQESSYNDTILAQKDYQNEALLADDTCYHQFRKPPKIEHATYKIIYEYIRQKNLWGIIANYTCSDGYHLEDQRSRFYFCRWYGWRAKVTPRCVEDVKGYNPCQHNNGGCGDVCVSYPDGSYQCECSKGYVLGADKRRCVDLDECKFENWNCEHYCVNVIGSYFCKCPIGYLSDDTGCLDLDECATPESNDCIGDCINTPGSYTCNCSLPGFAPSTDKIQCEDIDECNENNGGCEDICFNEYGSYRCLCDTAGYQIGADKHICTDIDECAKYASKICQNGRCLNTNSSYICECYSGYVPDVKNMTCKDVNECMVNNGGCAMTCINIPGSYQCACPDAGYTLSQDGHSCEDCDAKHYYNDTSNQCESCPPHSQTSGPYSNNVSDCVCEIGYAAKLEDPTICNDIDECLIDNNGCTYECENVPGSAHCLCADGYQLLGDGKNCGDRNECLPNNGNCAHVCINTDGSFHCDCEHGFTLDIDRHSCEDIDECYTGTLQCSDICENTVGSAHCLCERGYILNEDNQTCADIDECILGIDVCEDICINTVGSYQCECSNPGLKLSWDLASCADINECMEGGQVCHEACINTYGSFRCSCFQNGYLYETDNGICRDIDECQSNDTNTCQQLCINSDGSYTCDCFPGYSRYSFNECLPCAEGFYKEANNIECQACPGNSSTNGTAQTSITDCICQDGRSVRAENGYSCYGNVN
ncbi:hypothetical protein ACJMK2_030804 [Sinanodonta woodiana]|uniref:EGF-like domain-containing protein n=1 Tax=Sinanodonta woodiana TaxID=1069815 RepID=A0ABD3X0T8_SINWO